MNKYENFVKNDECSYIIHSPTEMERNDVLKIKISDIQNSQVYAAKGKGYKWINHLDTAVGEGMELDTRKDW